MSPLELQGKYKIALKRISAEADGANHHKPICQRNSQASERQAIAEAANALSALWKISRANKA